ncbi:MAG: hypothetical protein LCH80_10850 [Proteobacteria bacterium]|nr:hypothetical protein [Pseudomonadota bacterium]
MLLAWALMSHAAEAARTEQQAGSDRAPALSPPLSQVVTGNGRLQFHSAPDSACPLRGVFIIPKDEVIAYAQTPDGWSSVMYLSPRTGNDVSGWVRSVRLKTIGTIAPKR